MNQGTEPAMVSELINFGNSSQTGCNTSAVQVWRSGEPYGVSQTGSIGLHRHNRRDVGQQPSRCCKQLQPVSSGTDAVDKHADNPEKAGRRLSKPFDPKCTGKPASPRWRGKRSLFAVAQHTHSSPQQERSSRYMPQARYSSRYSAGSPKDVAMALATTAKRWRYL